MRPVKVLLATALIFGATIGIHAPGLAQQTAGVAQADLSAAELHARDQATNRALLGGLLRRRIEMSRSAGDTKASRAAIATLDNIIARVVKRAGR
jgi:hypothetical protein